MFKCFFIEQESANKYSLLIQRHAAHPSSRKVSIGQSFCSNTRILLKIFAIQITQRKWVEKLYQYDIIIIHLWWSVDRILPQAGIVDNLRARL